MPFCTMIKKYIEEDTHMGKYIITISRQFGSLGRPIAKEMASILNVEYYDR